MISYTADAVTKRADETVDCGEIIGLDYDGDAYACLIHGKGEFYDTMDGMYSANCAELLAIVIIGREVLSRSECIERFGAHVIEGIEQPCTFRLNGW